MAGVQYGVPHLFNKPDKTGNRFYELRIEQGLTMAELARRAGINMQTLRKIENGHSNPQMMTVLKLCAALGVSSNDIISE